MLVVQPRATHESCNELQARYCVCFSSFLYSRKGRTQQSLVEVREWRE